MNWAERIFIFTTGTFLGFTIMFLLSFEYWDSIPIEQIDMKGYLALIITLVICIGAILSEIWFLATKIREWK